MCRTFWGRVVARGISELAETAEIHRFEAETPLLVVLFWPRGVTVVAQLARAATAGGAQWADDGGPSTDL
jgi:hypothetical protein